MDDDGTISRLQSTTVVASIKQIIIGVLTILVAVFGYTFDIDGIRQSLDFWLPIALSVMTWYATRTYKGRIDAEKKVEPLPWRKELQTLKRRKQ